MKQHLAFALALVLLAGCGGGSGGSSVPATQAKAQTKTAQGRVVISIPTGAGAAGSARVRYPQFVSPNASSVALSINGGPDTIFDVSATSNSCTPSTGVRNCTLSFGAPVGSDTFAFLVFSGPNGTGTQLASATTTQQIATGVGFNFTVALNAAIGTMVIAIVASHGSQNCPGEPTFEGQNVINEGCAGSGIVAVTVTDPSGAPITGSAPYAVPITFTTNDPSLVPSPVQITAPGQTETISYTGAPFAPGITNQAIITATAGTQSAQAPPFPIQRSYLYVANSNAPIGSTPAGGGNVAVYAFGASGSTPPVRLLSGGATMIQTPAKVISDSLGNAYVLDNGIPSGGIFNGNILVFATGQTGNVAPVRTINNLGSLGSQPCTDMVFDPTGTYLFVACGTQINVFPASASGLASSVSTAQMQDDSTGSQTGLAFDPSGNMYIADDSANQIVEVAAPVPTSGGYHASVGGGATTLRPTGSWPSANSPQSLAIDSSGTLYAPVFFLSPTSGPADNTAELAIWNSGALNCTACAPSATLSGAPFINHAVVGVALDPAGNVYVANIVSGAITEFSHATVSAGSMASPPVLRTLSNTGSGQATTPIGMSVGP